MKKLKLGQVVVTRGVHEAMSSDIHFADFVRRSLEKHVNLDWGDTCAEDKALNDFAVKNGERVLAVYNYSDDSQTIWIVTEWDRSVTTVLFPHEY